MLLDGQGRLAGNFGVELDYLMAGWTHVAGGGELTSNTITDAQAPDNIQKKHIAGVKYEDITINCGTGMSKNFYDWIQATLDRKYQRKDGAIVAADYNYKEYSRLDFYNALISEVGFPALDASSKDAASPTNVGGELPF